MQKLRTYEHPERNPNQDYKPSTFHRAAKYALWAPLVIGVTAQCVAISLKSAKHPELITQVGNVTYYLYAATLVLGAFAVLGIFRHGARDILVPALVGMAVSGFLLGLYGAGLMRQLEAALHTRELMARARAQSENVSVNEAATAKEKAKADKAKADQEAELYKLPGEYKPVFRGPGNMAFVTQAIRTHLAKQRTLVSTYNAAALALTNPSVMDMKGVNRREQLLAKKDLVNKYLAANEKLLGFTTKAETDLRQDLLNLHSDEATVDTGMKNYGQSLADEDFVQQQIRATDQRAGNAMLAMLNLLDANFGNWKYDLQKKAVTFENDSVAVQYFQALDDMNAANEEHAQLQRKVSPAPTAFARVKPSI